MENLLRLLKLVGGKFIITDQEGSPQAVLMSYQEFSDLVEPKLISDITNRFSRIEEVNREITRAQLQDLREDLREVIAEEVSMEPEITVEPLI